MRVLKDPVPHVQIAVPRHQSSLGVDIVQQYLCDASQGPRTRFVSPQILFTVLTYLPFHKRLCSTDLGSRWPHRPQLSPFGIGLTSLSGTTQCSGEHAQGDDFADIRLFSLNQVVSCNKQGTVECFA